MQNQIRNSKFKPGKQYWKHTNIHVVYLDSNSPACCLLILPAWTCMKLAVSTQSTICWNPFWVWIMFVCLFQGLGWYYACRLTDVSVFAEFPSVVASLHEPLWWHNLGCGTYDPAYIGSETGLFYFINPTPGHLHGKESWVVWRCRLGLRPLLSQLQITSYTPSDPW